MASFMMIQVINACFAGVIECIHSVILTIMIMNENACKKCLQSVREPEISPVGLFLL